MKNQFKKYLTCLLTIVLFNGMLISMQHVQSFSNDESSYQTEIETTYQCGGILLPDDEVPNNLPAAVSDPPASWDWRDAEYNGIQGNWLTSVKKQGNCGSCWAFATIAMLETRLNIVKLSPDLDIDLSEQQLTSCVTYGANGCHGGSPYYAMDYLYKNGGAVLEEFFPYEAIDAYGCDDWTTGDCDADPIFCSDKLDGWDKFQVSIESIGAQNQPSREQIQSWIVNNGPLISYITIYQDLNNYNGGIYRHTYGSLVGGHVVVLIGYDDVGGYWIGKNSWGEHWGINGYFKIAYGEVNIDDQVYFADIDVDNLNFLPTADAGGLYHGSTSETIQFLSINSYDFDDDIVSYEWDFGDGTVSTEYNPLHIYSERGIYKVTLTVTDSHGIQDSDETAVFIDIWNIGNSWTYEVSFETKPDALYPPIRLPGSGSIEEFTLDVTGETKDSYHVDFQGSLKGDISLLLDLENTIFDFRFWGKIQFAKLTGSMTVAKSGLGIESMQLQMKGFANLIVIPFVPVPIWIPTPFDINIEKSYEVPRPILGLAPEVGKSWKTDASNSSLGITLSTLFGLFSKTFENDQVREESEQYTFFEQRDVPTASGIFNAVGITVDSPYNILEYYYAHDVSNIVKLVGGDIELFSFSAELISTTVQH